ncbi:MAG: response regulator transcription factor [Crocinitomicaceae bacterium]|nr:response regulator transcription factor [Crocinitomicaceae bacterium]
MKEIKILVGDDHALIRNGIRSLLADQSSFLPIIHEASNGAEVVDMASKSTYDIVLLDSKMPKMDGITAIRSLRELGLDIPVITLCDSCDYNVVERAIESGALGVILKNIGGEELVNAIQTVIKKMPYYCNEVSQSLLNGGRTKSNIDLGELTKREYQVLRLIAKELSTEEMASTLNISKRTVEGHRQNIKDKLRVKSTVGLVRFAYENGYMN